MSRGLDVLALTPSDLLTQNELNAAKAVTATAFNVQHQDPVTFAPSRAVALAYVDQLVRSGAVPADRSELLKGAIGAGDAAQLSMIATRIGERAASLAGPDAARMKALASVLTTLR